MGGVIMNIKAGGTEVLQKAKACMSKAKTADELRQAPGSGPTVGVWAKS